MKDTDLIFNEEFKKEIISDLICAFLKSFELIFEELNCFSLKKLNFELTQEPENLKTFCKNLEMGEKFPNDLIFPENLKEFLKLNLN